MTPKSKLLSQYLAQIEAKMLDLYGAAYKKILNLDAVRAAIESGDEEFSFKKHPAAAKQLERQLKSLATKVSALTINGVRGAFAQGEDDAQNSMVHLMGTTTSNASQVKEISQQATNQYREQGMNARNYVNQKRGGFTVSDRIWNATKQAQQEMEITIQNGILEGQSAAEISRGIRGNLLEPHRLFRSVRDKETGQLRLSKAAREYHPGEGVYRSSYKNAMRVARSEVNNAYRSAEWLSYSNNPLVKGYEIRLSNNHTTLVKGKPVPFHDICDELAGTYPAEFQWAGWHPQCRCTMIPIPLTPQEFAEYTKAKREGRLAQWELNKPTIEMPKQFTEWIENNHDRIKDAKSLPYFIRDNFKDGNIDKGLAFDIMSAEQRFLLQVKARHEARTPEQIEDIKKRWAEHKERENIELAAEKRHANIEHREKVRAMAEQRVRMQRLINDFEGMDAKVRGMIEQYHKAVENGFDVDYLKPVLSRSEAFKTKVANDYSDIIKRVTGIKDIDVDKHIDALKAGKVKNMIEGVDDLSDIITTLEGLKYVPNGIEKAKKYSYKEVVLTEADIANVFERLKSLSLEDSEGVLMGELKVAVNDMYKDEYSKKLADVRVDIFIRDATPRLTALKDAAAKSTVGPFKDYVDMAEDMIAKRDIKAAKRLIDEAERVKPIADRYEDMMAHKGKGSLIPEALRKAYESLENGDVALFDKYVTDAEIIRKRNEASNAMKKAAREAAQQAKEKKEPEQPKVDPNAYIPKTLDELKSEMESRLPRTLESLDKSIEIYKKAGNISREIIDHKEEVEGVMRELFKKHDYGMNMKLDVLDKVLDSWFKNTFETGTSGGYKGSSKTTGPIELSHYRLEAAHKLFLGGRPKTDQLERGEYEKYGNLLDHDKEKSITGHNRARSYGECEVRFKKTKVLVTWTAGDSLGERWQPSLVTDPKICSYDRYDRFPKNGTQTDSMEKFRDSNIASYLELQYHGRVTLDCVDSITFPYDINTDANARRVAEKCRNKGIDVYYLDKHKKLQRMETPVEARKRVLAAAKKRHEDRDKKIANSGRTKEDVIKELMEKRAERIAVAHKDAGAFLSDVKQYVNKDIALSDFDRALRKFKEGDYLAALGEVRAMKDRISRVEAAEKAMIDLIPDVKSRHQVFTIAELQSAYDAIKKKLNYIEGKYTGNTRKQFEKLLFEVDWINDPANRKHRTWEIARDAYQRKASELGLKIRVEDAQAKITTLKGMTKAAKVTELLKDAEKMLSDGDYDGAELKIAEAEAAKDSIKPQKKKTSDSPFGYADEVVFGKNAYSARRKLEAIWKKNEGNPQKAFDEIDAIMSKYAEELWKRLTKEEKHVLYMYTAGSKYMNEPFFQDYNLVKRSPIDGSVRNIMDDINMLTTVINKAKPLEHDMWVQHAEDMSGFAKRFGINLYGTSDLKSIIGKEAVNKPFMSTSCAKHSFFTSDKTERGRANDVVLSIFLPKGTKGVYCEPFAHFGDGKEVYGSERGRYGTKGFDWDGTSQQEKGFHASDQVEFLLQRGAKLKITSAEYKNGKWYVECELTGQTALEPVVGSRRVQNV